ncbi:MAG: ribosomal protein S18-alanine N-acetyltransferase [Fimbriimonadaceae bacterium]
MVALAEQHIPAILEIEQRANPAPWSERSFRNELDHKQGLFRVALVEGRPIGYGGVWLVIDEAHVTTLAVDETMRRLGIGRALIIDLLLEARDQGMLCATLEVRASNSAAVALYESLGFTTTARRKKYYPDNREDALVMWLADMASWTPSAS